MTDSPPEGLSFVCTTDGAIVRLVDESLAGAAVRDSLSASVDESSKEACAIFLRTMARGGFSRSTPLRIGTRDVQCYGSCADGELRIVAVIDPNTAAPYAEYISSGRNEPAFMELAREIRRTHSTYELYEELARMNNDLATAQRELARTVDQLQRLNSYKDELLGVAAHDLRNPLNANAAFITFLLQDPGALGDNNKVLLERLRANSQYMLRLVDDVLDFSAIEAGHVRLHLERSDLGPLVQGVVDTMRIIAEAKQVDLRYSAEGDLPPVNLDQIKISQVVQNVISNAVQYSSPGTRVDVRLRREAGFAVLEVEDRGPGIPPDELPNLFKPFTRLSTVKLAKQRSVGLGLAITRRLVEAHGGSIGVRSEVGRGSVFTIRLRARP
ncbi:MAG TPA: HAMP domain-containing sensor histidine kinase [Thermoanaerobaculia bacterium]|nr:HAMP domain-containing sensor histidine kinase [Thermoanaerobaculia bacterium]